MKYIIDLDTGIDDTFALIYLLSNHKDVLGVTTTFGNVTVDRACINTLSLLDLFKYDIPVFKGGSHKYKTKEEFKPSEVVYKIHGQNGIANIKLNKPKRKVEEKSASDFIIEQANKYGKDLTLIMEATLTNLAIALDKDEKAIKKIGHIVLMGGALTVEGNASKYAEANIHNDYKAAKRVFESGINLSVVGLDVTMKTIIKVDDFKIWNTLNNKNAKVLYKMLKYYAFYELDGVNYAAMHDPLAVEVAINRNIVKYALPINLKIDDKNIKGKMIGDLNKINDVKAHEVILDVNSNKFIKKFVRKIYQKLEEYE